MIEISVPIYIIGVVCFALVFSYLLTTALQKFNQYRADKSTRTRFIAQELSNLDEGYRRMWERLDKIDTLLEEKSRD